MFEQYMHRIQNIHPAKSAIINTLHVFCLASFLTRVYGGSSTAPLAARWRNRQQMRAVEGVAREATQTVNNGMLVRFTNSVPRYYPMATMQPEIVGVL